MATMSEPRHATAELHLHLDGAIEPETLCEIDPSLTLDEAEANTRFDHSFADFLRAFVWVNRRLCTPAHYAIATRRLIERLHEQGIVYAEITLSAGVVLWKGQNLAATWDAVWRESCRLRQKVETWWILDAVRQFGAEPGMEVARFAASQRDGGVIAYGIGGDEVRGPALWFRDVFAFARDAGLRLVCHAGETAGPQSVWDALEIGAERIGHGIAAAADARLMEELRLRDIPLEVCLSSNAATGVTADMRAHPLPILYAAGVPVTLNTDDPALFRTTLDREFETARDTFGFSDSELAAIGRNSLRYRFTPAGTGTVS